MMDGKVETFLPIVGYGGYFVSDMGRIFSTKNHKGHHPIFIKPANHNGYRSVMLVDDSGKNKMFLVHTLVAECFIGPKPQGMDVNHKNENKSDNRVENLEYLSRRDNLNYGTHNARMSESKSHGVIVYDKQGKVVATFKSLKIASEVLRINHSNICGVVNGKRKTAGGFVFKSNEQQTIKE